MRNHTWLPFPSSHVRCRYRSNMHGINEKCHLIAHSFVTCQTQVQNVLVCNQWEVPPDALSLVTCQVEIQKLHVCNRCESPPGCPFICNMSGTGTDVTYMQSMRNATWLHIQLSHVRYRYRRYLYAINEKSHLIALSLVTCQVQVQKLHVCNRCESPPGCPFICHTRICAAYGRLILGRWARNITPPPPRHTSVCVSRFLLILSLHHVFY